MVLSDKAFFSRPPSGTRELHLIAFYVFDAIFPSAPIAVVWWKSACEIDDDLPTLVAVALALVKQSSAENEEEWPIDVMVCAGQHCTLDKAIAYKKRVGDNSDEAWRLKVANQYT